MRPYTTATAEAVAAAGWDVTIHTGYPHYPEWERQPAPESARINGVTVRRHRHSVPTTPTTTARALMDATWAASTLPAVLSTASASDVVMGIVPNLTGSWVAHTAARRAKAPLVLWFQDLMGQAATQSGIGGGARVARLVQRIERSAATRADAVIVAADGFRPYFVGAGVDPDRIHVVRNWSTVAPSPRAKDAARVRFGLPGTQRIAVHSGNMGLKQGLDVILDAAAHAPDITWVLQGNGSERPRLEREASSRGLTNVIFLEGLGNDDLADLLAAADVLVLTQRASVIDMSLPSKLTTYFTAHRPIVASINAASEAAGLISEGNLGTLVAAGDGGALATAVRNADGSIRDRVDATDLFGSPTDVLAILGETIGVHAVPAVVRTSAA